MPRSLTHPMADGGLCIMPTEKDYLTLGRQTLLEPIEITEDGWLKAPLEKKVEEEIPSPLSLNGAADSSRLDEFRIGFDWKFYKRYQLNVYVWKATRLCCKHKVVIRRNHRP